MGRRHLLVSPLATSLCTAGVLPIQGRHSRKSVEHTATLFLAIKTKTMRAYHLKILKTQDSSRPSRLQTIERMPLAPSSLLAAPDLLAFGT